MLNSQKSPNPQNLRFKSTKKITASLSIIAALRFFGLFVVMPTLALFVQKFGVESTTIIGVAISAYAVSQIVFQVPFGILGDRFSKRAVISFGLVIFGVGSLVCAYSTSVEMLIFGRILQGAGAIGSVISAKITDLIIEEKRGGAMAFMGICIFISFIVAMIVGSVVGVKWGTDKLFLLTAILAFLAIIPLWSIVPKAPHLQYERAGNASYARLFGDKNLTLLNISIAVQKFLMSFAFVIIPIMLTRHFEMAQSAIWKVFSLGAVAGMISLAPSMIIAEKKRRAKEMLLFSVALFGVAFLLMGVGDKNSLILYTLGVVGFFCAFCISEPILQNLASKYPKMQDKSVSLGIFTTFGYLGSFFGGIIGGFIFDKFAFIFVIWVLVAFVALWFLSLLTLQNPKNAQNLYVKMDTSLKKIAEINALSGVIESYINQNENLLIVKFDSEKVEKEALERAIRV